MKFTLIATLLATVHCERNFNYHYNPEEYGDLLEGDIAVSNRKTVLSDEFYRWPNATVPYKLSPKFTARERDLILDALNAFHTLTCIRFVPKVNEEEDYIKFQNKDRGCWSFVGRQGRRQILNLDFSCFWKVGTIMHEIMHALGFIHEQNRNDRDDYVKVQWENITPGLEENFEKEPEKLETYHVKYDYNSILHYSVYSFSANDEPTIFVPKNLNGLNIGQRIGFSCKDLMQMNLHYNCKQYIGKPVKSAYLFEGECPHNAT